VVRLPVLVFPPALPSLPSGGGGVFFFWLSSWRLGSLPYRAASWVAAVGFPLQKEFVMFIEVDAEYLKLLKLTLAKDSKGLFEALQALPPKDPKVPAVLDMIKHVTGVEFETVE